MTGVQTCALPIFIVADNKDIAESVSGLTCIQYFDDNPAFLDGTYEEGKFIPKQIFVEEKEMTDEEKIAVWGSLTPPPKPDSV